MAPKRKAVTATTDLQALQNLFKDYHKYPTEKRRNAIAESIKQCLDQRLPIPPKVPFHQGAKKLRAEQEHLDEEVDRIASLIASRGKHSARRMAELRGDEENARKQAQLHSDENVIVSRHYQNYAWEEPSNDLDDEEEEGGEEEEEGGENGVNNGQTASEDVNMTADEEKSRKAMEKTEAMRNMATAQVHELWQFWPKSQEKIREGSGLVHLLHRDYLRLAFHLDLDSPTPIPRRLIDTTAPSEFQEKLQQAAKCSTLKIKADQVLAAATTAEGVSEHDKQMAIERHRQETVPFHQERAELTAWSQMTLAMFSTADNPHTNYQYIDDGMGEPHHGGEVPDAEFTASQLARYGNDLKSLRTTTQQPTTIKPYLSTPITECTGVIAFRNNLIAVKSGVGIYKLIPIGEQIFHTRSSLERDDSIHNASNVAGRVLHNLKEKPNATKAAIVSRLVGIVGIAHRGYHTLNVESAKKHGKRIGDCMIEVAWTSAIPDSTGKGGHVGTIKMNSSVGYHTSFETRTDWRAFRGKAVADMEIYRFAKDNDNGLIAPDEGWGLSRRNQLKAIEAKVESLKKTRALLTQRAWSENAYYSDSENGDNGEISDDE